MRYLGDLIIALLLIGLSLISAYHIGISLMAFGLLVIAAITEIQHSGGIDIFSILILWGLLSNVGFFLIGAVAAAIAIAIWKHLPEDRKARLTLQDAALAPNASQPPSGSSTGQESHEGGHS
jgi:hypothetical protein